MNSRQGTKSTFRVMARELLMDMDTLYIKKTLFFYIFQGG